MFTKVLIADDIDFNDVGAAQVLKELGVQEVQYTKYCDDAFLKLKRAALDQAPFDLLISDLSFKSDHQINQLNSGQELTQAVKALFPELKVIVFSIEDRSHRIKLLFDELKINGYVLKGRNTMYDLRIAVQKAFLNQPNNVSAELWSLMQEKPPTEIDAYDILLMKKLSLGVSQEQMEQVLRLEGVTPNSKSTIEKHLNKLKIYFQANNTVHLVAIAKDLGII
jgi:two-component system capsular synthesis response regulator RcsB